MVSWLPIRILRQLSVTDRTLAEKVGDRTGGCMEASDKSKSRILRFHSSDPDSATAITVQIPSSLPQLHLVLSTSTRDGL